MVGIVFILKDDTKDWYDPVNKDEFVESEIDYQFYVGGYHYTINKADVESYEFYDLEESNN